MKRLLVGSIVAVSVALAQEGGAVELGEEGSFASVDLHAFVSQGVILSTSNNYLDPNTTHGSFQYSEIGVNLTKNVTDNLRMGVQFYATDLGTTGSYNPNFDWAYLDYRWKDWLGFRAGRVKIPFGLYNEIQDADSARVPVLLPQSVYPVENVNYLLAQTGGEVYGYLRLGHAGALEYRAYGGTIFINDTTPSGSAYQIENLTVPFIVGSRILWETPLEGLRFAGSFQALHLDATLAQSVSTTSPTMSPAAATPTSITVPVELWVASAEWAHKDLVLTAEYSQWYVESDSSSPLFSTPLTVSAHTYGMATYRVNRWFQPAVYYAFELPETDKSWSMLTGRGGGQYYQHDLAATLRFDINRYWLWKLEGHFMSGTAEVDPSLNGLASASQLSTLTQNWGVFLVKTTAYF